MKNPLSEKLKFYRKSLGLTQEQVASAIGINRSTYTYYEKGTSSPNLASLIQISNLFGVEYSDLIGESSNVLRVAQNDPIESIADIIPFNTLTKMEKDLLCRFRVLSDVQKIEILKNMGIEKYQSEESDE